jgi:cyd operon protein YbgT
MYHFLFVPLMLGLSIRLAIMESPPHSARVHRVGVLRAARPGDPGADRERAAHQLLRGFGAMWYFSWILGLSFAAAFAALNAMWLELAPGKGLPD